MENEIAVKKVWVKPELKTEEVLLTEGGRNIAGGENATYRT